MVQAATATKSARGTAADRATTAGHPESVLCATAATRAAAATSAVSAATDSLLCRTCADDLRVVLSASPSWPDHQQSM